VPFTGGFNSLVGGLGCGKSSVLYAVDFAFFGEPLGRSFDYLLREGAPRGKVAVQFTHNGRTYKITRGLKRLVKGISQDIEELKLFEDERLVASMKTDAVAEQFKAITGLDREIYREIVWVRQEHLKELLDAAPRERQRKLDELFGLSEYEAAWENIAEYQKGYEGEKRAYERDPDIVGLDKLGLEYNHAAEEFTAIDISIQKAKEDLAHAKKTLEEANLKLMKLEEKKKKLEDLKRNAAQTETKVASVKEMLSSIAERIEGKKTVVENLKQRYASLKLQITQQEKQLEQAGATPGQPVEAYQAYLTSLEHKLDSLRGEREALLKSIEADAKRAASLSLERKCPLCLQPLNDVYKDNLVKRVKEENDARQKTITQLNEELEKLTRTRTRLYEALNMLRTLYSKAEDLQLRINEEEHSLNELVEEYNEKERLNETLQAELSLLRAEITMHEILDFEQAKQQRDEAMRRYYTLESELHTMENKRIDLLRRLDELKERIDNAQQKIERMQKITKILKVTAAIRDAYRSIQPILRREYVKVLRNFVQQVLDDLTGEGAFINVSIDETYTPSVLGENNACRDVSNLSGGERTLVAFAYRLGLGQLIMHSRTGHGLSLLLLDEPTENLGSEDGSIERLADAISRFKAIEQIIAVTHSEAFAEKAEHVVKIEKEAGVSRVSIQRG
jgi:exonuclease SbcC